MTVEELFQALNSAHPRSQQIIARALLSELPREKFEQLYGVTPAAADALIARALEDAKLTGQNDALREHRTDIVIRLERAAKAYAASPDRLREERLRQLAIVIVIALTAFFYWQQSHTASP